MKKINEIKIFDVLSKYRTEIMGIAAIWVFLLHRWERIFETVRVIGPLEWYAVNYGACGVDIFMFISGIGLVFAIEKSKSIKDFYYRRIKRILIPYLIEAILFFGLSFELLKDIIGYNFFFVSLWQTYGWFFHAIAFLYLIFPLYYKLFKKIEHKVLFTILLICLLFGLSIFGDNPIRGDFYCFINRLPFFVAGITVSFYGKEGVTLKYNIKSIIVVLLIMFCFEKIDIGLYYYETSSVILSACLIYLLPLLLDLINSKILFKCLAFVGACSYELYLLQMSIGTDRFYNNFPTLIANILLFMATLAVSYAFNKFNKYFWIIVEKVCNKVSKPS